MTKNEIFAQTLLHKVKQQNETGVVGKFYTLNDVLTVYHTYLPKIINIALNCQNYLAHSANLCLSVCHTPLLYQNG